jgi:hypothetical protein
MTADDRRWTTDDDGDECSLRLRSGQGMQPSATLRPRSAAFGFAQAKECRMRNERLRDESGQRTTEDDDEDENEERGRY